MAVQPGSGTFFLFVALLFFTYWAAAGIRYLRLGLVLLANYLFCAHFGLFYVAVIPACSAADYAVGLALGRFTAPAARRLLLGISLAVNLGLLLGSRHMDLLLNRNPAAPEWDWIFPLGLSFYAFQSLTYTIDVYRGDAPPCRSLLAHLTAASFFPSLTAGPITRVADMVRQFDNPAPPGSSDSGRAFFLIGAGLFKKAVIADYLAANLVNRVFDTPGLYSGAETLLAVYGYSLQLYYDFSGYTDIARGAALLLGIRLPVNFDRPYMALNVTDFWRRWHLSFSNWLRDYLYFALPGARTRVMPYVNLVITMLLGGLWHGIAWTFAIWGLLHGVALAAVRGWWAWRGRNRNPSPLGRAAAMLGTYHFVCLTWIFFRAATPGAALEILGRIGSLTPALANISPGIALVLLGGALALFVPKAWHERAVEGFARTPFYVQAAAMALVAAALQLLGGRGSAPFVYSRF
jgi:alginate O-acetyltransferase complex protein AlgI